jgi:hypothetical protein
MKETLVCSICEKNWKRDLTRGRKPTVCPKCVKAAEKQAVLNKKLLEAKQSPTVVKARRKVKAVEIVETVAAVEPEVVQPKIKLSKSLVYRDYYPLPSDYKEMIESTKNGSEWHCPDCKKTYVSQVPLVVAPTHRCPPLSTKIKSFERVRK